MFILSYFSIITESKLSFNVWIFFMPALVSFWTSFMIIIFLLFIATAHPSKIYALFLHLISTINFDTPFIFSA